MFRRGRLPSRRCAGPVRSWHARPRPRAQLVFESVGEPGARDGRRLRGGRRRRHARSTGTRPGWSTGARCGMTIGWDRFQSGNPERPRRPRDRPAGTRRLPASAAGPWASRTAGCRSTWLAAGPAGRASVSETVETFQVGATLVQTIVPGPRRGRRRSNICAGAVATGPSGGPTVEDALDRRAWTSTVHGEDHFDFDIGLMADIGQGPCSASPCEICWQPQFTSAAGTAISCRGRRRVGVAVLPDAGLTLAMDVDLDTVDLRDGLRRMIALGGEDRLGSRVAVRGGVRWSLEGESQPVDRGRAERVAATGVLARRALHASGQRRRRPRVRRHRAASDAG